MASLREQLERWERREQRSANRTPPQPEPTERRAWIAFEEKRVRDLQDRAEYQKYIDRWASEQKRVPPADRIAPLDYDQWSSFLPADEPNPEVRGAIASGTSTFKTAVVSLREIVASQEVNDDLLLEWGFDLTDRVYVAAMLSKWQIRAAFEAFTKDEPRYQFSSHYDVVTGFLSRNQLYPSEQNIQLAFDILWNFNVIEPKLEPEQKEPGLNEYGVRLEIEPSPEFERQRKKQEYFTKVVAAGPDGRTYTQFALDRLSADEYRRVVGLYGDNTPRFSNVIRPI